MDYSNLKMKKKELEIEYQSIQNEIRKLLKRLHEIDDEYEKIENKLFNRI
jgi:prefoldin subunit 5